MIADGPGNIEQFRQEFSMAASFFDGRLEKRETIKWALGSLSGATQQAIKSLLIRHRDLTP
jgi:hypothetical protein